jgi:hypothetical protein
MNAHEGFELIKTHITTIKNIAELQAGFNLLGSYKKEFGNCNYYEQLTDKIIDKQQELANEQK